MSASSAPSASASDEMAQVASPAHASPQEEKGDSTASRKRARSPPYPPFVQEYRPYSSGQLQAHRVNRYTDLHKRQWDLYYRNNTVNGYKDRHYILREFYELRVAIDAAVAAADTTDAAPTFAWMEAGCGVGNAMLPVFTEFGHLQQWRALLGFDISSVAIALLKEKRASLPPELAAKVHVCVLNPAEADVTDCTFFKASTTAPSATTAAAPSPLTSSPATPLPEFVSLIFVLCSIPVSSHVLVLRRIAACMARPGGVLYFRDYAVSDHAERRFQSKAQRRRRGGDGEDAQGSNTYERTNGTLSHFFSVEEVRALFEEAGFAVIDAGVIENEVTNRKTSVSLARRFLQGRFRVLD